ncbi:MAG: zinc ABC transporter substrate-binding protein [Bdellovibrionota bacterium]|nr:MAG: zinc ABC transporter substrate-binding protein [Bdellovibrionota bacterium]
MKRWLAQALLLLCVQVCTMLPIATRTIADTAPLKIVATTGIVADLCKELGGSLVQVEALMGPGVDPHLYKATHGDLGSLRSADAIVFNGLHLEGKLSDILAALRTDKPVLALGELLPADRLLVVDPASKSIDPHIWFDVSLLAETIPGLTQFLVELLPGHAQTLRMQETALLGRFNELHRWAKAELSRLPEGRRVLVTAHDAFGYFGRAYGLEVHGLQGVSTAVEYGVHDIARIVELVVERKLPAIFVESSVPQRFVEAVIEGSRARGHIVALGGELYSDALGEPGSEAATYMGMVRHNVRHIVSALAPKAD